MKARDGGRGSLKYGPTLIRLFRSLTKQLLTGTYLNHRRVMRCGQDGMDARRTAQAGLPPESNSGDSLSISRATTQPPVLAATRRDGALWAHFVRREPLQYRHIAAGSPPRTASHIASVAHVPMVEIGSREHEGYPFIPVHKKGNHTWTTTSPRRSPRPFRRSRSSSARARSCGWANPTSRRTSRSCRRVRSASTSRWGSAGCRAGAWWRSTGRSLPARPR